MSIILRLGWTPFQGFNILNPLEIKYKYLNLRFLSFVLFLQAVRSPEMNWMLLRLQQVARPQHQQLTLRGVNYYFISYLNPLVPGRKSSPMFKGVQPASYCTQLANYFEGGYKHNKRPHQKLGQLYKNLIFGEWYLFVTPST